MSTLMMPAPTMACPPIAVGPHKPPETKLLAIHPTHAQTTPQHQIHAQQQQPQQSQQQQQLISSNKPGMITIYQSKFVYTEKATIHKKIINYYRLEVRLVSMCLVREETGEMIKQTCLIYFSIFIL